MNAIVSVTKDWGIGMRGRLLVPNREDMRFFVQKTMGGTVICGRKTFQSFPGGPLKGRHNIVLTSDPSYQVEGATVVHSLEEALDAARSEDPNKVWVIGGERVYRQLIDKCDTAYVTMHDVTVPCDARFPNLDEDGRWAICERIPGGTTPAGIPFEFLVYAKKPRVTKG